MKSLLLQPTSHPKSKTTFLHLIIIALTLLTACADKSTDTQAPQRQRMTNQHSNTHLDNGIKNPTAPQDELIKYYNSSNYQAIFDMYHDDLKTVLPKDKNHQLFTELKSELGNLNEIQNILDSLYLAKFDKGNLMITMEFDNNNQISMLELQPDYTQSANNQLTTYPKAISTSLFHTLQYLPNQSQIAIAVTDNDKTDYYGAIRQDNAIKPTDNKSKIFEIGSITKVFTATILADMVTNHQIKLNDTINAYYPELKDKAPISLISLANHTSGLPRLPTNLNPKNHNNPYADYDEAKLSHYLQNELTLGEKSLNYSNIGYGLLGDTLSRIAKQPFDKLIQKNIFDKIEITISMKTI